MGRATKRVAAASGASTCGRPSDAQLQLHAQATRAWGAFAMSAASTGVPHLRRGGWREWGAAPVTGAVGEQWRPIDDTCCSLACALAL